jgi:hypothetical protein
VMVKSQIIKANGEPVKVDYLMRRNGDSWLISDIYVDGAISEVAHAPLGIRCDPEERGHRRSDHGPQPQGRYSHRNHCQRPVEVIRGMLMRQAPTIS